MAQTYRSPRTLQPLGMPAPWTLPMLAPRLVGYYGRNEHAVAVDVGGVRVERLPADPITGRPRETVKALLERAAMLHGTGEPYRLLYAED